MAVLPLRIVPDPVLRQKAKRVSVIDASIRRLSEDMIDTLRQQTVQCHMNVGGGVFQKSVLHLQIIETLSQAFGKQAKFFFGYFGSTTMATN